MPELDEAEVQALITQLDEAIPREGAVVVEEDGEHYDEHEDCGGGTVITANRRGYLRLGVELLKAAFAEPRSEIHPHRVDVDLSYLFDLDEVCYSFQRREDVRPRELGLSSDANGGFVGELIGPAIGFFLLASLAVGAFTILRWLLGLLL